MKTLEQADRLSVFEKDEVAEMIAAAIDTVIQTFGGFDLFVSNAGVLKAESVKTQPEKDFDFVTEVNYKGYFLCTQCIAPIFAAQHHAKPDIFSDIIQINSKSGLEGSKRNFAYAGSKFGGIGLTQSFALELIEDGEWPFWRAAALNGLGDTPAALQLFKQCASDADNPYLTHAALSAASIESALGQLDEALLHLERAAELAPDNERVKQEVDRVRALKE